MNNYLFTGQELDDELDLYNYNARLYNPTTGAFVSADTVGGGNHYAYAANNPLIFTDPSGHAVIADGGGGGLGITPPSTTPSLPVIESTTPINPTIRYDPLHPDPSYYNPYTPGEFERAIVGMAAFSSAAVTVILAVPATVAYLSFLYNYYTYSAPAEPVTSQAVQTTSAQELTGKGAANAIAQRLNQAADLVKQGANEEAVGLLTDKAFAKSVGISIDPFVAIGDASPTDLAYKSMSWESGRLTVPTGIYEVSSGGDISVSYPTKVTELLLEEWHHAALRLGGFQGDVELPVYRWFEMRGIPHTAEFGQRYGRAEWWASLGD